MEIRKKANKVKNTSVKGPSTENTTGDSIIKITFSLAFWPDFSLERI